MNKVSLSNISTKAPVNLDKKDIKNETKNLTERLATLQRILTAENKKSLLIIFQGMDAAGKDGVVKAVFSKISPSACSVTSFKKPTEEELTHDFLWRVHKNTPANGMIKIFNRSHYEDVLIQRIHQWIDEPTVKQRFNHINNFEKLLTTASNINIIKFFLHVSKEKQLERLQERIDIPSKKWKYDPNDMKEREHWDEYMKAYEDVFEYCSPEIPWNIVPSDQNWYKEYLVSKIIVEKLESMSLSYPT